MSWKPTNRWEKQGRIFTVDRENDWMRTHVYHPVSHFVEEDVLRIYFGTRDEQNRARIAYMDVRPDDPKYILEVGREPVLDLAKPGLFDDSGVVPTCKIEIHGMVYLYYLGIRKPWSVAVGVAVSYDNGRTFHRCFGGPILDRTRDEPYGVGAMYVMRDENMWKGWYADFQGNDETGTRPTYHIKYTESDDGINWRRDHMVAIPLKEGEGGLGKPLVFKDEHGYEMWYCYRGAVDFRGKGNQSYRIGFAGSHDGYDWKRWDIFSGITVSESGWDSEMVCYPEIYAYKGQRYMLYNGNGFGQGGLGYATENVE